MVAAQGIVLAPAIRPKIKVELEHKGQRLPFVLIRWDTHVSACSLSVPPISMPQSVKNYPQKQKVKNKADSHLILQN